MATGLAGASFEIPMSISLSRPSDVRSFGKNILSGALRMFSPHIDPAQARACCEQAFAACHQAVHSLGKPSDMAIFLEQAVKCCVDQALLLDGELLLARKSDADAAPWREALAQVSLVAGASLDPRARLQFVASGPSWLPILVLESCPLAASQSWPAVEALCKNGHGPASAALVRACLPPEKSLFSFGPEGASACGLLSGSERFSELSEKFCERWLAGGVVDSGAAEDALLRFGAIWTGGGAPTELLASKAARAVEALRSSFSSMGTCPVDLFSATAARVFAPALPVPQGSETSWPKAATGQKLSASQALFLMLAAPDRNLGWTAWALLRLAEPSPDLFLAAIGRLTVAKVERKILGNVCLSMAKQLAAMPGGLLAPSRRAASITGKKRTSKLDANVFELLARACLVNRLSLLPDEMAPVSEIFLMLARAGFDPQTPAPGSTESSMDKILSRKDTDSAAFKVLMEKIILEASVGAPSPSSAKPPRL